MTRTYEIFPKQFPEPWASDWGEDEYGIFMGFIYKGVRQDFRWIEPGTFLMGSPQNEEGRYENETQHEVMLTKGFWLAETTVTQSLWQVVMGENPSHFKGTTRPVEQISWEDTQRFIAKMNNMKPELQLCLPTEAQWEYACRAGTTTPFSFGEQINSALVNFDGTELYNRGQKSAYRQQTIEVKSLPPNAWGLYEMHGNVWEWCQDYHRDIWVDLISGRGCRGGAWNSNVREVRCAVIYGIEHNIRSNEIGFRFARSI